MRLTYDGKLAVGTPYPSTTLHVLGDPAVITAQTANNANAPGFRWMNQQGTAYTTFTQNMTNGNMSLDTAGGGAGNLMTLLYGGNVGIGTASPGGKLELAQYTNANGPNLILNSGMADGSDYLAGLLTNVNAGSGGGTTVTAIRTRELTGDNYALDFATYGSPAALTTRMTMLGNGNVGIGTPGPTFTLDVQAALATMQLKSTTGTSYTYMSFANTGGSLNIGRESSAGGSLLTGDTAYASVINSFGGGPLQFGAGGLITMTLSNTNVGIQTTAPKTALQIYGSVPGYFGRVCTGSGSLFGIAINNDGQSDCTHYSLLGDGTNTFLNRPSGGQLAFREGNGTQMVIDTGAMSASGRRVPAVAASRFPTTATPIKACR